MTELSAISCTDKLKGATHALYFLNPKKRGPRKWEVKAMFVAEGREPEAVQQFAINSGLVRERDFKRDIARIGKPTPLRRF